jgi:amidase
LELPPGYSNQDVLISSTKFKLDSKEEYDKYYLYMRKAARNNGLDKTLRENDIDIILGPGDSELNSVVAASGESFQSEFWSCS